ncbi:MAG TPA: FxLYD domain-containing protein [Bryobacteraceae bacterium]|nr:FxLYD domain-containing protein [Bryobacteraceae bacterium]
MGSRTAIFVIAIAAALAGGLLWFVNRPKSVAATTPLSADAKAYVRNLKLSEVTMKATESYVGQTVTEIEGKIGNGGDRTVQHADVYCVFYNSYGEVILRERAAIVVSNLKPGETRSFRLPFDDIPGGWNNQMPQLVIARIEFT